eukprot:TRINITY_DN73673_c0_g1_i1.p1 TRINITY_DN73673_c0_g1~~TRINITY_DN73673_c0_g1_i1.p1  ORF type:complete len:307 (-),score=34.41 TRINITY_DN73673_c0_g1_i1:195-1115(-)
MEKSATICKWCTCCACCTCLFVTLACTVVPFIFLTVTARFLRHFISIPGLTHVEPIKLEEVHTKLPLAPASYPDHLHGILWMDQEGFISNADVFHGTPDLALSFGDTNYSTWDARTQAVKVEASGASWQWMNNREAYMVARIMRSIGFFYLFEVHEADSYVFPSSVPTYIQVYPSADLGLGIVLSLPKRLMSFTMVKMTPPPGKCPPASGASRDEWTQCASWKHASSSFLSPFLGGTSHCYAYQIVDARGQPIQPYFDAYVAKGKAARNGDARFATLFGISIVEESDSFVMRRTHVQSAQKKRDEL